MKNINVKKFVEDNKKKVMIGAGVVAGGVICKTVFKAGNYYGILCTLLYITNKCPEVSFDDLLKVLKDSAVK